MSRYWDERRVLVTGGASFIGSHVVEKLIERGTKNIRVVDDLSSGKLENIQKYIDAGQVEFTKGDLLKETVSVSAVQNIDTIFHLAADHGGRGYVDLHQVACATNLALDNLLYQNAHKAGVEQIVFASSGCVYPNYIQTDTSKELYLTEDIVGPPYDADHMYGWAKLMSELTLQSYVREKKMKTASLRYFTVYGERGKEDHAVMAMIARAFVKHSPFTVWGTGEQIRNWTYVKDIAEGTLLAAEKITDGRAINLGTVERIKVIDCAKKVLEYTGHKAEIKFELNMPTGPMNRVADNSLAKKLLGWEPTVLFNEGLKKTIDWYFSAKNLEEVKKNLDLKLTER